jgi:hypothetical protein
MTVSTYKLASVLLQYPRMALLDGIAVLEAEAVRLPRPAAVPTPTSACGLSSAAA